MSLRPLMLWGPSLVARVLVGELVLSVVAYSQAYPELVRVFKETVKRLHEAGVRIAAGTDSGSPGVVVEVGCTKKRRSLVRPLGALPSCLAPAERYFRGGIV